MSILKKIATTSFFLAGLGTGNYALTFSSLPTSTGKNSGHSYNLSDLTVVFTGNNARVTDALKIFSRHCAKTKKWLLISGAGKRTTLRALLKQNNLSVPKECINRIMVGSHALKTTGNAKELKLVLSLLRTHYDVSVGSITLMTSWCHAPRALTDVRQQGIPSKNRTEKTSLRVQFVGSCHLGTIRGATLALSEIIKLPLAQMGLSEQFSDNPFSQNGRFTRGYHSIIKTPAP